MVPIDKIKEVGRSVAEENGATLAILFGSYAKGTATRRSDVDIIFVEDTDARFLDRLARHMDPLSDRLQAPVEVLVYAPDEFERMKTRSFVKRAVEEGIVLYERG
ncbi:MAG: nucleotidyltransferase domain-containing protein [Armatimonadota bacterium]|nr:nucleotidyltransferase domain-containing protein [Armatimonadota bacterium]